MKTAFWSFISIARTPVPLSDAARQFKVGDAVRLGELRGGALHYDPDWQEQPLWLLAAGTGLGPLYGVLREALRQDHQGPIRLVHVARDEANITSRPSCKRWRRPTLSCRSNTYGRMNWRTFCSRCVVSRQTRALVCGHPDTVEAFAKRLFLAGLVAQSTVGRCLFKSGLSAVFPLFERAHDSNHR
jgi:ferredoxin-NADP reductase